MNVFFTPSLEQAKKLDIGLWNREKVKLVLEPTQFYGNKIFFHSTMKKYHDILFNIYENKNTKVTFFYNKGIQGK